MSVSMSVFLEDDPEAFNEMFAYFRHCSFSHGTLRKLYPNLGSSTSVSTNSKLSSRFNLMLDVIARAAITHPGEVATAAASVEEVMGALNTTVYISFNQGAPPEADSDVASHIESLFSTLRGIVLRHEAVDQSGIQSSYSRLAEPMYEFGWRRWEHYLGKRMKLIPQALAVVAQAKTDALSGANSTALTVDECESLSSILKNISDIGKYISIATKRDVISAMSDICDIWMEKGYIDAESKLNLFGETFIPSVPILDKLQVIMSEGGDYFPLHRWIQKISSFYSDALVLFRLVHSKRMKPFLSGSFTY